MIDKLRENLDLIVFIAVGLGCAWVAVSGAGTGRTDHDIAIRHADKAIARLRSRLAEDRYEQSDGARVLAGLDAAPAEVRKQWEPRWTPTTLPDGLFHDAGVLDDLRNGVEAEIRFEPPIELKARAEVGSIDISWQENPITSVAVSGYAVYREAPGRKRERVGQVDASTLTYRDPRVQPGILYSYRVTAITDDKDLVAQGHAESAPSAAIHVRARTDYEIEVIGAKPGRSSLRVKVRKFFGGVWHEKEFDAKKGGDIGIFDPGSRVDYRTRCTVLDIVREKKILKEKIREVVLDETGRVVVTDNAPATREVEYDRPVEIVTLVFRNALGQTERRRLEIRLD